MQSSKFNNLESPAQSIEENVIWEAKPTKLVDYLWFTCVSLDLYANYNYELTGFVQVLVSRLIYAAGMTKYSPKTLRYQFINPNIRFHRKNQLCIESVRIGTRT